LGILWRRLSLDLCGMGLVRVGRLVAVPPRRQPCQIRSDYNPRQQEHNLVSIRAPTRNSAQSAGRGNNRVQCAQPDDGSWHAHLHRDPVVVANWRGCATGGGSVHQSHDDRKTDARAIAKPSRTSLHWTPRCTDACRNHLAGLVLAFGSSPCVAWTTFTFWPSNSPSDGFATILSVTVSPARIWMSNPRLSPTVTF
jgi:hypothetical protein